MKKIVVFTGAGISVESNIPTFRDAKDGLWYNYNVEEVATLAGLRKNPKKVNEFHNLIRAKVKDAKPNLAHTVIAELEKDFEVTVVTQNIDVLHEAAGSTNVLHLHGNLFKSRSTLNPNLIYDCFDDILDTDRCEKGSRLRPHTVLFEEMPYHVEEAYSAIYSCDYLLIVGTSLSITYTIPMLKSVNPEAKIFYIDPAPSDDFKNFYLPVTYIKKKATEGMVEVANLIK